MTKQQLRAIVKQDNARRAARRILEDATLGIDLLDTTSDAYKISQNRTRGARVNPCLVRGIGTVNPPAPTSASRNSWDRGMSRSTTVGIAPNTVSDVPTVAVHKDGITTIVPVSSFSKRTSTRTTRKRQTTHTPETARITLQHDFNTH